MQNLRWVFWVSLILSFCGLFSQTDSQIQACSEADRVALLSFKSKILKDTTDILSSWMGRDCCGGDWEGVECNSKTGRVTGLQLQRPLDKENVAGYMKGTISSSLGSLQFLETLVISGMKQIEGNIPESFSKLTHLTQLVLEGNNLEGSIPTSLGQLPLLNILSLSGNRLKGQIPPSLGNLQNLLQLNLAKNLLTGQIPPTLKNFFSLQYFDLSYNLLSGLIPDFIGQFHNLTFIDLSNNQLSGKIPNSLCSLTSVLDISLSHNHITGRIPDQIGNLKSLTTLSLSFNLLSGQIPESISRLQNLWYLNLSGNGFSEPLPATLTTLPSLLSIDLSYNDFHLGLVPDWIRNRGLTDVHLAGCNLRGILPNFLKPDSLNSVDLSDNFITGEISSNFFTNMSNLQKLKLSNNLLRSDVSKIVLPEGLALLNLNSNQLYGSLSAMLNNNKRSRFLEMIDISNNKITGGIPEFSEQGWSGLKSLNLSRNNIIGEIPNSISNLIEVERLDFSRNHIIGRIPTSLGKLVRLQWLDLSVNGLTGKIPDSLLGIATGIRHVNFRANRLCGEIPQGRPFNIFPAVAYAHNTCLCGKPMPPCNATKGR